MAIKYNYSLPSPLFMWDAQNGGTHIDGSSSRDLLNKVNMIMSGVTVSDPPAGKSGKVYTFNNGTNSFNASNYIRDARDSDYHNNVSGASAFVLFKNSAILDSAAPTYYRQTPFSYGSDGSLGGWNFERFYQSGGFSLRYKYDQQGTFGATASFGTVPLDTVTHLGFTNDGSTLRLYKDGVQATSVNVSAFTLTNPATRTLGVGAQNGSIYGFIGEIYNAAYWNRGLSETEVTQLYNNVYERYKDY